MNYIELDNNTLKFYYEHGGIYFGAENNTYIKRIIKVKERIGIELNLYIGIYERIHNIKDVELYVDDDFILFIFDILIDTIDKRIEDITEGIKNLLENLEKVHNRILLREQGKIYDLPSIPDTKYEHNLEWLLSYENSGLIIYSSNLISSINNVFSKLLQKKMKNIENVDIDFFIYDPILKPIFAQLVAINIIKGRENSYTTYRPKHAMDKNKVNDFDLYNNILKNYIIEFDYNKKVYYGKIKS